MWNPLELPVGDNEAFWDSRSPPLLLVTQTSILASAKIMTEVTSRQGRTNPKNIHYYRDDVVSLKANIWYLPKTRTPYSTEKMSKFTKCVDDKMYQSSIHILYFTWINFHLFYSWTIFKLGRLIDFLLFNVRLEIISSYGSRHYHCGWNVGLWLTHMVIQHED